MLSLNITYYVTFWNLLHVFHTWSPAIGGLILFSPLEDLVHTVLDHIYKAHTLQCGVCGIDDTLKPQPNQLHGQDQVSAVHLFITNSYLSPGSGTPCAIRRNIGLKFSHNLIAVLVLTGGRAFDAVLLPILILPAEPVWDLQL